MAGVLYYHDIDLLTVSELKNARIHNIADLTAQNDLAATLGTANKGLIIYNVDLFALKVWNGTAFVDVTPNIDGDVIFRGVLTDLETTPAFTSSGSQYIAGVDGTLTFAGVTFTPSAVVEIGDVILFTSPTAVSVFQRNDVTATTTVAGNIKLATQAAVTAGTETDTAVTPATLKGALIANQYARTYTSTVNLVANTPFTISHGLNLPTKDAFTLNATVGGNHASFAVASVNVNSLTITSSVTVSNVSVTVIGSSTA